MWSDLFHWFRSATHINPGIKPPREPSPGMYCSTASLLRSTFNLRSSFSVSTSKRCLQRTRTIASASKALPAPDVQKLAQLAHITVTEQQARSLAIQLLRIAGESGHSFIYAAQVQDWEPKLQSILQWFSQLQQADVTGIEPAVRADVQADNVLRDDIPQECESRADLMAQVPDRENAYVKVPKIM